MYICRICGNSTDNKPFIVREMMFGLREEFEYFACSVCGCLQIAAVPTNLSKYYPPTYYSFTKNARIESSITRFLKHKRARNALGYREPLGAVLRKFFLTPIWTEWIRLVNVDFIDTIADVGSGGGYLIVNMHNHGFLDLTGIDPFIENDVVWGKSLRIFKCDLSEVKQSFDFLMLNHSLEHVIDPHQTLKEAYRVLKSNRFIMVRTPVADSFACREYGENWVQLDAPRHICIPTEESMRILAEVADLELKKVVYDSTAFQFWGSEQYRLDIPLRDQRSYSVTPQRSIFTKTKMENIENRQMNSTSNHRVIKPVFSYGRIDLFVHLTMAKNCGMVFDNFPQRNSTLDK